MDHIEFSRKGGSSGTGKSKVREAEHYARISALGVAARLRNKKAKAKAAKQAKGNAGKALVKRKNK